MPPPPPVEVDGQPPEWWVEEILNSRLFGRNRRLRYLIKWRAYEEVTWEPAEDVSDLKEVDAFHERYPEKPGPLP